MILQKKLSHILCRIANLHCQQQLNDCSMKSPKNRDLLNNTNLHLQLSPENKTRTLSRSKASNQGAIRRQVLSPNPCNNLADSIARQASISKMSRGQRNCLSPNLQQSRMAASPEIERSGIISKLQELMNMASNQENHSKKQRMPDYEMYKKIQLNEWECDEIDKLKQELVKSYAKLKEVQKMHWETEKKTLILEQAKQSMEKEIHNLRQRSVMKDDVIFNLEQRIIQLLSQNQDLHKKVSQLQMSIVHERYQSIQSLKEHLLSIQNQGKQIITTAPPTFSSASSSQPFGFQDQRLKKQLELVKLELQSRQLLQKEMQEQHKYEKKKLQDQLQMLSLQLQALKNLTSVSPAEHKKQRERQQLYLLYIQASSIENLLREKQQHQQ